MLEKLSPIWAGKRKTDREGAEWLPEAIDVYESLPIHRSSEQQKKHFNDRRVLVPGIQH